nr:hypothetical protein [Streptomyces spiramyceticus]
MAQAPVIVFPPLGDGGRRVTIGGEKVGLAKGRGDLMEFLRRAGLDPDSVSLEDPGLIEWRGGGPDEWGPAAGQG